MDSANSCWRTLLARLALLAIVGLPVASPSAHAVETYTWKSVQIHGGGYVSGIVFHPTTQNLIYARTDVGGAYRWDAPTSSWIPLNDDLPRADSQLTGVLSLALDPNDSNRVYLACGQYLPTWGRNAALLRSTNRGASWSRTELPIRLGGNADGRGTGERLQVDPNKGSILFLGTNQDGLWKSTDSGVTWSQVATTAFTPTSTTFVLFDKRSGSAGNATQTIYVGVNGTGNNLYRSTNGGASWATVSGAPSGLIPNHAEIDGNGMLYVSYGNAIGPNGMTSGALWKFNTGTSGWTNISPRTPSSTDTFGYGAVSVSKTTPGTIVASTNDRWGGGDEIWRSTDSGATWTSITSLDTYDASAGPWVLWHRTASSFSPHWVTDIDMDPFNNNHVLFVTGAGLWGTDTAFGTAPSWTFRTLGLEETVPIALISPPSGAPLLSALGDIAGFRHDDVDTEPADTQFYNPIGGTNSSIDFAQSNPAIIVRTTSDTERGARSTDGGSTWTAFAAHPAEATANGSGSVATSVDGFRILWIPNSSVPYYSTNNGSSWTASSGGPTGSFLPVSDRVNASKFYIYDSTAGRVYVSTNGGANFTAAATVATGGGKMRAVTGLEGNLWIPAGTNGLLRSTNSGTSFTAVASVQNCYVIGFGKAAYGQTHPAIYIWGVVNSVEGLYRSDDVGASWIRINDDAHRYGWVNVITGDPRKFGRVYVGTGGRGIVYGDSQVANGTYRVIARHSGMAMSVAGNGLTDTSNVEQETYTGSGAQKWTLTSLGGGQYKIIGVNSGKSLDVVGKQTGDGINIQIYTYNGGNNQKWTLVPTGGGYFTILSVNSGKAVDVAGASLADPANIQQYTSNGGANQQWIFQAP